MPRNSSGSAVQGTSTRAIKNKPFYYSVITGRRKSERKDPSDIYFASELEFKVYRHFEDFEIDFLYQPKLTILDSSTNCTKKEKVWDFRLVPGKVIVECKGQWINSKAHRTAKYLFLLECHCAELQGYEVVILGDLGKGTNQKPFQIGNYKVQHFKDYIHGLYSSRR